MIHPALTLTPFYKGWGNYQRNLVKIITPLTPAQLALPASPQHWTIGMIAQHIIGNRVWWFQLWMGKGNPALAPLMHWDPADEIAQPALDATELVAGLNATWEMIADALASWTPDDLAAIFLPPASLSEAERQAFGELTRQWIIWHVLEHEIHHGGELSLVLGNNGLKTIYD